MAVPATAAREITALTVAVVVYSDGTTAGYNHRQSASRAARGVEGARVLTRQQWVDEVAARLPAQTAPVEVEAPAAEVVEEAPVVDRAVLDAILSEPMADETPAEVEAPKAEKAPKAPRRGQGTDADVRHAALKAQARKLTLPERRALAARVHATVHALLDEMCATATAGEYAGTALADVSAADLEVCAGNWMWHVPGGGLEWGQNR